MENNIIIKETNDSVLKVIDTLRKKNFIKKTIDVNFESLVKPNFNLSESERLKDFENILNTLESCKNKPCIYVFEIINGNSKEIIKAYKAVILNNKAALRKNIDFSSKCLYVGKSQKGILHRLKVHFGYKDTGENGLQLLHWIKSLDVRLRLDVYSFEEEIGFLLPLYEKSFNAKLNPLIGYL